MKENVHFNKSSWLTTQTELTISKQQAQTPLKSGPHTKKSWFAGDRQIGCPHRQRTGVARLRKSIYGLPLESTCRWQSEQTLCCRTVVWIMPTNSLACSSSKLPLHPASIRSPLGAAQCCYMFANELTYERVLTQRMVCCLMRGVGRLIGGEDRVKEGLGVHLV